MILIESITLWLIGLSITFLLIVYLLLMVLQYTRRKYIIDITTNQPLKNYIPMLKCFKDRVMNKKHVFQLNYEIAKKFNFENVQMFVAHYPTLLISNAEDAKKVLLNWKEFPKNTMLMKDQKSFYGRFLGENIVFVNHEQWRTQRSIMNPAFYTIERFGTLFTKEVFKCLDQMKKGYSGDNGILTVPIAKFTTALALDVLGLAAFKFQFNMLASLTSDNDHSVESSKEYVEAYHYIMGNIMDVRYVLGNWYAQLPLEKNRNLDKALTKMDELIFSLIKDAKERKLSGLDKDQSLLDMMMDSTDEESGKHMTDRELRDNIMVFFLAGHDTT
jgi:cytochrome P450